MICESLVSNLNRLVLLATDPPVGGGGDGLIQMLTMMGPLIIIFWLLIWRPESKRRKERQQTLNTLKIKDEVVTVGGLYGTVVKLDKDDVTLLVDPNNNVRLKFRRSAIESITESAPLKEEKSNK